MEIVVPAITDETRKILQASLDKTFSAPQGSDLDAVVTEVLHDQQLFTYLAAYLPNDHGIYVDCSTFWDDTTVHHVYGLTLDNTGIPRHTALFSCQLVLPPSGFLVQKPFLARRLSLRDNNPTPSAFCQSVNYALSMGRRRCVPLTYEGLLEIFMPSHPPQT